jgi:hypothetical protein
MPTEPPPEPAPSENLPPPLAPARSLPQAARIKPSLAARLILIAVGVLWLGVNGVILTQVKDDAERLLQKKIEEIQRPDKPVEQKSVDNYRDYLTNRLYLVVGGSAAVGIALIVLGVLTKLFPLPCTASALALCVIATGAYSRFSPEMTAPNWAWKILSILALLFAVYSAAASPKTPQAPKGQKKPPQKNRPALFIPR